MTTTKRILTILDNLRDRGVLKATIQYRKGKGLIDINPTNHSYRDVYCGTPKECEAFLEGIDYISNF